MTRNDTFYKILFAIQLALLPLTMSAYFLLPVWSIALFVVSIVVVKIWMELFKNKEDRVHALIGGIGNALTISTLVIFFTVQGFIESVALCVFVVIFVVLINFFRVFLFNSAMPEMVDAVDACNNIFDYLTLITLAVVAFRAVNTTIMFVNIALFALLLTAVVSVAYKIYYIFKTYDVWGKIKSFFAKLIKRK